MIRTFFNEGYVCPEKGNKSKCNNTLAGLFPIKISAFFAEGYFCRSGVLGAKSNTL